MSVWLWLGVALLGGAGAVVRFALDATISRRSSGALPVGTLAVNLSGAFVLGLVSGAGLSGNALLLVGSSAVGAYTTFSTWMLETHRLAQDAERLAAVVNIGVSLAAGIAAVALGRLVGG